MPSLESWFEMSEFFGKISEFFRHFCRFIEKFPDIFGGQLQLTSNFFENVYLGDSDLGQGQKA